MKSGYTVILIISIGVFLFSAKKIYEKLNNYLYCSNIMSNNLYQQDKSQESLPTNTSVKQDLSSNENQTFNYNQSTQTIQNQTDLEKSQSNIKNYKINIRYENKKAKNVKLSGSFWAWKEKDMRKISPGVWEEELVLKEKGVYKYYFIVDGKRVLDTKAKHSQDGRFSIFEIK